jgi:hypothetical protein
MELESNDLARLRSQASRGELILFTGAGFSLGAKDYYGRPIPSSYELKRELWELCYPGDQYDNSSYIGDLYWMTGGVGLPMTSEVRETAYRRLAADGVLVDGTVTDRTLRISIPSSEISSISWFTCV